MERIAVGGMAEIFLARRCGPGGFAKLMALKRVLPELARQSEFREMFADEARLCASLSHPGLVQVFDYGEVDDTPYLAMEWVDGGDLTVLLDAGGPLPTEAATFIMAEVVRALAYVHDALDDEGKSLKIVHRDLSPGNILISRAGDVKLGDFGVAKARGRLARTEAGQLKGTLAYLSPEQVSGGQVDERTDVYAVGLLLFELLTGERYVQGDSEVELLKAASHPKQRSASECCADVPDELDKVLGKALALDPERRFPNAAALELSLRRFCPDTSGSRGLVEQRVSEVTGAAPKRRQTEMMCVDPEATPRGERRTVVPLYALVALIVVFGGVGFWRVMWPGEPERAIVTAPPIETTSPTPPGLDKQQSAGVAPMHGEDDAADSIDGGASGDGAAPIAQETGAQESTVEEPSVVEAPPRIKTVPRQPQKTDEPTPPTVADPELVDTPSETAEGEQPQPEEEPAVPDLARLLREADQQRSRRGLVSGDDQTADQLRVRASQLVSSSGPANQAVQAVTAYRQRLDEVAIDRAFIDRKMQRVSRRIAALDDDSALARELDGLSQQAIRRAMGGDYDGANRILNRILSRARR